MMGFAALRILLALVKIEILVLTASFVFHGTESVSGRSVSLRTTCNQKKGWPGQDSYEVCLKMQTLGITQYKYINVI